MRTELNKIKLAILAGCMAGGMTLTLTSCTKGSSITATGEASVGGSGAITITKVYPSLSGPSWTPITLAGRYYIKGVRLTITGTCDRGIGQIHANEGGPDYPEEATCTAAGTFTWTKTDYAGQSDKTISFTAYDVNNTLIAGATTSVLVRMDNVAPGAAVVTTPASSPYTYASGLTSFNIIGTCDNDVAYLTSDGVTITPSSPGNWSHTFALTGGSQDFHFYATDLAGNSAGVTTQTLRPGLGVEFASVGAGGQVTGTSGYGLEATLGWDAGEQDSTTPTGVGTAWNLQTGFNYVMNVSRSLIGYVGF